MSRWEPALTCAVWAKGEKNVARPSAQKRQECWKLGYTNAEGCQKIRSFPAFAYTQRAERACPSLTRKNVSPHVLRHAAAMDLLQHGVDRSVIALWLGHESMETTQMYLHADLRLKEKVLARTLPLGVKLARYRPDDKLLAFLESL